MKEGVSKLLFLKKSPLLQLSVAGVNLSIWAL